MRLDVQQQGDRTLIRAEGRLDAAWSDHLMEAVRGHIREGRHRIWLDGSGLDYMSSAGVRALLRCRREVEAVNGSFGVLRASPFVRDLLRLSGLDALLVSNPATSADAAPDVRESAGETAVAGTGIRFDWQELDPAGRVTVRRHDGWIPWSPLAPSAAIELDLSRPRFALGIGAAGGGEEEASARYGEFVAAGGSVAWLPSDGADRPDYLEQTAGFRPGLRAIQALVGEGRFSHLLRFDPVTAAGGLDIAHLVDAVLRHLHTLSAVVVGLLDIDGIVGASLARSPARIRPGDRPEQFPEIREWIAFCGERLHRREQALLVAFASRPESASPAGSPEPPTCHAHAAVMPYRPLPRDLRDLATAVQTVFTDNLPVGVYHLLDDSRPAVGLGQSRFTRGVCWCAPADRLEAAP